MEPPRNRAITMTCSMLALVKEAHMLVGKMLTRVSIKLAEVAFSHTWPSPSVMSVGNRPAALNALPSARPMTQAIAVVQRKKATVFQPTEPTFFMSAMDTMP